MESVQILDLSRNPVDPANIGAGGATDGALTSGWDGTALSTTGYGSLIVGFTGISGGDTYQIKGSLTGANPTALAGVNLADLSTVTTVSADGKYEFSACGQMTFTKTGSSSTPTVNAMRKR